MPIRVPDELPAVRLLRNEQVFVMTSTRAHRQEIRPLKILLLNLMPKKIETETQFIRLLSNSPLQLDIQLLRIDNRTPCHTPKEHLDTFYRHFTEIQQDNYDGLIVTGAPLGQVAFENVEYWSEFCAVLDWAKRHVTSTMFMCWAAQAALNILYAVPRQTLNKKISGVYPHQISSPHALLTRGFDDTFLAPHSRYAAFDPEIITQRNELELLATSPTVGAYLMASKDKRQVFVTGHPEYDANTLAMEYLRDKQSGLQPVLPENYFPGDDYQQAPSASWRSHGYLLFSNWLNYYVYQITPYDLSHMNPSLD